MEMMLMVSSLTVGGFLVFPAAKEWLQEQEVQLSSLSGLVFLLIMFTPGTPWGSTTWNAVSDLGLTFTEAYETATHGYFNAMHH